MPKNSLLSLRGLALVFSVLTTTILYSHSTRADDTHEAKAESTKQEKVIAQQSTQATFHTPIHKQQPSLTRNPVSVAKYARVFIKSLDLLFHSLLISLGSYKYCTGEPYPHRTLVICCGRAGTMVSLIESIQKDIQKPLSSLPENKPQQLTNRRLLFGSLCKLSGMIAYGLLLTKNPKKLEYPLFSLPHLAFLGHGLHSDYKSYLSNKDNSKKL